MKPKTLFAHLKKFSESKGLSADDMRLWFVDEVRNVLKDCELRLTDAVEFTTDYMKGKITPKEANKRFERYENRWSDPLAGHVVGAHTDEQILHAIDNENQPPHLQPGSMASKVMRRTSSSRSK